MTSQKADICDRLNAVRDDLADEASATIQQLRDERRAWWAIAYDLALHGQAKEGHESAWEDAIQRRLSGFSSDLTEE